MADSEKIIRLVFFDMEGTLFRKVFKTSKGNTTPSVWTVIAKELGPEALEEEELSKDKWNNKEYSGYIEWMEDTIKIHQKYGLTKEVFERALSTVDYWPGVKETFEELRKRGYRTILISGGFKTQSNRAQRDLKINHAYIACEYFWDKDGKLNHWNLLPCDYEGKAEFVSSMMKHYNARPEECAFVGDGINDVPMALQVGTGISFNGHPELERVCKHIIRQPEGQEDFRAILEFLP